jgi:predicted double-glycine peptidase
VLQCLRILKRVPTITLETVHRELKYLLPIVILVGLIFAILLAINASYELSWRMPTWVEFACTWVTWAAIMPMMAFTFALALTLSLRTGHRERYKLLVACVSVLGLISYLQWRDLHPAYATLSNVAIPGRMIKQTGEYSCAPAAAANIVQYYGLVRSEQEMAKTFGTTRTGTSWSQIIRGMWRMGFACRKVRSDDRDPTEIAVPAILFIDHPTAGKNKHAVSLMRVDSNSVSVWDPSLGRVRMSHGALRTIWRGYAIECKPSEAAGGRRMTNDVVPQADPPAAENTHLSGRSAQRED